MVLVKLPVPVPSKVFVERLMVGPVVVLQHTPRAVMLAPPSAVTFPPEVAEVAEAKVPAVVVRVASTLLDWVVKNDSLP